MRPSRTSRFFLVSDDQLASSEGRGEAERDCANVVLAMGVLGSASHSHLCLSSSSYKRGGVSSDLSEMTHSK